MSLIDSINFGIQKVSDKAQSAGKEDILAQENKKKYYIYGIIAVVLVVVGIVVYIKFIK